MSPLYRNPEQHWHKKVPFNRKKPQTGPGSYWGMLMLMVKEEEKGRWCQREGQRAKRIHHKCKCISCRLSFWWCRYKTEGVTGAEGQSNARESALAVGSYTESERKRETEREKERIWVLKITFITYLHSFSFFNSTKMKKTTPQMFQNTFVYSVSL